MTKLYYFTGTGNSLYVAKKIAEEAGGIELLPIVKESKKGAVVISGDAVGFVTPLYFCGLPKIVADFIGGATFQGKPYIFGVITAGHPELGAALSHMKGLLGKKSLKLKAGFYVQMVDNYAIGLPIEEESKELKAKIDNSINNISGHIKSRKNKFHFEFSPLLPFVSKPWLKTVNQLDKGFYVQPSCTSCGICQKVCCADNIVMKDGHPAWQHHCQLCLSCLHFCPQKSIQYGNTTESKKRYHNPNIKINEIIAQKGN